LNKKNQKIPSVRNKERKSEGEGKVKVIARRKKKSTRMMANYGMPLNQSRPRGGKDMTLQQP